MPHAALFVVCVLVALGLAARPSELPTARPIRRRADPFYRSAN